MNVPPRDPVGPPALQGVLLVERFVRRRRGHRSMATSRPGHLIHLVTHGRLHQEMNGREYDLEPGCVVWYHDNEQVRAEVIESPWTFYSVNFVAPTLSPPPFERRVWKASPRVKRHFELLLAAWRDRKTAPAVREMRVQGRLLSLLAEIGHGQPVAYDTDPSARLWWDLEVKVRRDLSQPLTLADLAGYSGRSIATIARSCHQAVGMAPLKRIKQVRLSLAAGLVRHSRLSLSEIASRVGYGRVHEFSRDYRKHFGHPASADRL